MQWFDNTGTNVPLPSFISFTSTNSYVQSITISPTVSTEIGTYTLKATFDPDNGLTSTYPAIIVTVTCLVTSMTKPSDPSDLPYDIYSPTASYNVA